MSAPRPPHPPIPPTPRALAEAWDQSVSVILDVVWPDDYLRGLGILMFMLDIGDAMSAALRAEDANGR